MTREEIQALYAQGPEAVIALVESLILEGEHQKGADIVCTGDMGIGNTTASSAIIAVLTGSTVESVTGRGTGVDDAGLHRKVRAIKQALASNLPNRSDPVDVLAKVGGYEIGGLVGVMLAGAACKMPVVIDGLITSAAALIAAALEPKAKDYFIAGHCSAEIGHKVALEFVNLKPLLNLEMRLGEGSGAALAMSLIEASTRILAEMATFEQAGVSGKTSS